MKSVFIKLCLCILLIGTFSGGKTLQAQPTRSLYFMDNAPMRLSLNPALQPTRGYFNIPVIGSVSATAVSDPLTVQDFTDIIGKKNGFLNNEELFSKLKAHNEVSMDCNLDLISLGFYAGKGFWTVNVGAKIMIGASIPKSMFEFARDADNFEIHDLLDANYEVKDLQLNADLLAEIGVGYSRSINDRLTVGGRFKFLTGLGNLEARVDEMSIHADRSRYAWQVESHGSMKISMKGINLTKNQESGYIDDLDIDAPGVSGFGMGIDLGASYNLIGNLTLSAAILDLGFVKWSASSTTTATTNSSHIYDASSIEDGSAIFNFDLIQFTQQEEQKKRTTSLRPVLNAGAEYTFLEKKIGLGLLTSTRFQEPKNFTELTFSANYHPKNWFGATLSYSFLHSDFKTFGLGLKLGPVILATDYMITGGFDSISRANAYLGISVPLGRKKQIQQNNVVFEN